MKPYRRAGPPPEKKVRSLSSTTAPYTTTPDIVVVFSAISCFTILSNRFATARRMHSSDRWNLFSKRDSLPLFPAAKKPRGRAKAVPVSTIDTSVARLTTRQDDHAGVSDIYDLGDSNHEERSNPHGLSLLDRKPSPVNFGLNQEHDSNSPCSHRHSDVESNFPVHDPEIGDDESFQFSADVLDEDPEDAAILQFQLGEELQHDIHDVAQIPNGIAMTYQVLPTARDVTRRIGEGNYVFEAKDLAYIKLLALFESFCGPLTTPSVTPMNYIFWQFHN
jgi:hypothetical protein